MQLKPNDLKHIHNVLKVAKALKIENVVIGSGSVCAISNDKHIVIFQQQGLHEWDIGTIGINRIDAFTTRLGIAIPDIDDVAAAPSVAVEHKDEDTDSPWVRSLKFKNKRSSIEYRCANPKAVRVPKTFVVSDLLAFDTDASIIKAIQDGLSAMKTDTIRLYGTDDGVFIEMSDINGDSFIHQVSDQSATIIGDVPHTFTYTYQADRLLSVCKLRLTTGTSMAVTITTKGILKVTLNKMSVYILPKDK